MCTAVHVLFCNKIYCTNSNGLVRFNLLTRPSLFSSRRASKLMYRWSRCSWLWAYFLMTLSTVSTSRSLCRLSFRMYQAAPTIPRSTLFRNLCIMFLLLWVVQPRPSPEKYFKSSTNDETATTCLLLLDTWRFHSTEAFYSITFILLMIMTMEAEFPPEMLITTYQSTRCHDREDSMNIDSCFYKFLSVFLCTWLGLFHCKTESCSVR